MEEEYDLSDPADQFALAIVRDSPKTDDDEEVQVLLRQIDELKAAKKKATIMIACGIAISATIFVLCVMASFQR